MSAWESAARQKAAFESRLLLHIRTLSPIRLPLDELIDKFEKWKQWGINETLHKLCIAGFFSFCILFNASGKK
jgi:hypothetical protein